MNPRPAAALAAAAAACGPAVPAVDLSRDVVAPGAAPARRHGSSAPVTVYLNFEGGPLSCGEPDDARENRSVIVCEAGLGSDLDYPAFSPARYCTRSLTRGECIEAIVERVRELWADFDIAFVTERPGAGDYEMVMVGGALPGTAAAGLAPGDCGNANPDNVAYAFSERTAAPGGECARGLLATTISQELAHALGMCHIDDCEGAVPSLMCPSASTCDADWGSGCHVPDRCTCNTGCYQPYEFLMDLLGPARREPPEVAFLYPADGARLPRDFQVRVRAGDDRGLDRVEFFWNDAPTRVFRPEDLGRDKVFSLEAERFPRGDHVLRAVAFDRHDLSSEASVRITVQDGLDCAPGICCCGPTCCAEQCACDGAPSGAPCDADAGCLGGVCAGSDAFGRFCTQPCPTDDWICPPGLACREAAGERLCWPDVGARCRSRSDCALLGGECVLPPAADGGAPEGFCTVTCGECPQGWRCGSVGGAGLCLPEHEPDGGTGDGSGDDGPGCRCRVAGAPAAGAGIAPATAAAAAAASLRGRRRRRR